MKIMNIYRSSYIFILDIPPWRSDESLLFVYQLHTTTYEMCTISILYVVPTNNEQVFHYINIQMTLTLYNIVYG